MTFAHHLASFGKVTGAPVQSYFAIVIMASLVSPAGVNGQSASHGAVVRNVQDCDNASASARPGATAQGDILATGIELCDLHRQSLDSAKSELTTSVPSKETNRSEKFHWGRALLESFELLSIEQAYVVHTDYRWVVSENGVPFNHYWRDYMQSLHSWKDAGWSDGDPNYYGYVGHPIQGAFTSYIQIQNDPRSERLEFSNTKAYWRSRLKATVWNAVYSTQWNLGPLSEVTVEKYGTKERSPWNRNGTWPCTEKNCYSGVGQIDIVMTPIGGMVWLIGEEWMDKNIARRVERASSNRFLIDAVRCTFNPVRAGANVLHGSRPWFRPRDTGDWHFDTR